MTPDKSIAYVSETFGHIDSLGWQRANNLFFDSWVHHSTLIHIFNIRFIIDLLFTTQYFSRSKWLE